MNNRPSACTRVDSAVEKSLYTHSPALASLFI